jgi:hypothetical protein
MKVLSLTILLVISAFITNAQSLNFYHNMIKKLTINNFKSIQDHHPEDIMSGVSDKTLEHTFAGDNSLSGTRHDKESLLRWFKRINLVLPDLKINITDKNPVIKLQPAIKSGGKDAINAIGVEAHDLLMEYYKISEAFYVRGVTLFQNNTNAYDTV